MTPRIARILSLAAAVVALAAPAGAQAITAQEASTRTEAWLERVLGADVPTRAIAETPAAAMALECPTPDATLECVALAYPDRLLFRPRELRVVERTFTMGPVGFDDDATLKVWIHEHLHDLTKGDGGHPLHEGIVEALAIDLTTPFLATFPDPDRWSYYPPAVAGGYVDVVHTVRKASALATGRGWKHRDARIWRRHLWTLGEPERLEAVAGAYANPAPRKAQAAKANPRLERNPNR
jgi:hypothetical protein